MTAAVDDQNTEAPALVGDPPAERPEGAHAVTLPVMVVEGLDTSDRRFIEAGSLTTRTLPITLYAQTRSTHGADGDAATWVVGAITKAERIPGPEVVQRSTGEPFPEGTYVWRGEGWMYPDVPAAPHKSAYEMLRDGALRGNSVDLSGVEADFEFAEDAGPNDPPERIITTKGVIAATTLVGQPAFQDAYAEVEGMATLEPTAAETEQLAASAWLSADVGDNCWTCQAATTLAANPQAPGIIGDPNETPEALTAALEGVDLDAADMPNATPDTSTSGMIALIPENPNMLRVPGGDPSEELHLTLAYLGDEINTWDPELIAAVHRIAAEAADYRTMVARIRAEQAERGEDPQEVGRPYKSPAQEGPLTATVFSHAVFNPNGDNGHNPATVYQFDGSGDRGAIEQLASEVQHDVQRAVGTELFPEQHTPFVPHVTAGYGVPVDQLTYTGPVVFSHLRVAIGDDITDYPLGGGDPSLVASAATLPPLEWFTDPKLDGPTPLTVDDNGRAYGHLATWGTCHIGFQGQCVQPPASPSGYAYFQVHSARARNADGDAVTVPVGWGTVGTGHAGPRLDALAAAEHYDNTGTAAFELAAGEDAHGIWVAGRLLPGLDELTEHKARGTVFSGDWRTIRGALEMVAALGVNTGGFPVPRVRVASGAPVALTAAGLVIAPTGGPADGPFGEQQVMGVSDEEFRSVVAWVNAQRLDAEQQAAAMELTAALGNRPTVTQLAETELELQLYGDHPWYAEDVEVSDDEAEDGAEAVLTAAGRKVLHLPPYIKRIEKHLEAEGMSKSHAIASAVNAAKKMCASGDLNFPGSQQVNPGSRAQACKAVAQWKKDRPGAK
jgi:hypothetical protein